jgi:hypothetical protein
MGVKTIEAELDAGYGVFSGGKPYGWEATELAMGSGRYSTPARSKAN